MASQVAAGQAFLPDMEFVFLPKMLDGGQDRIGAGLAQAAERGGLHRLADALQLFDVSLPTFSPGNSGQDFEHLGGPQTAGRAFAAGFILGEGEEITGNIHHAGILIHDDHPARTHHGAHLAQGVIIDGDVQNSGPVCSRPKDLPSGPL